MRRQNFKTPLLVSGILAFSLLTTLVALLFQAFLPEAARIKAFSEPTSAVQPNKTEIAPLAGHWLMTGRDKGYRPASLEVSRAASSATLYSLPPVLQLEQAASALNHTTDSINIMYIWTDGDRLNVISVTSFNKKTRQAAIVVIPLYTVTNCGASVDLRSPGRYTTIQDLYRLKGREGVREFLREKLDISIPNFVHVNQSALQKISDIIGVINVNGDRTTMLEAFQQTMAGARTDDPDVVKAVASQVLRARMLLEVPKLLWIFTRDIKTDFTTEQMVTLFHFSRQMDLGHMRKTALPGVEYPGERDKYLFVSDRTWKNVIYEMTTDKEEMPACFSK